MFSASLFDASAGLNHRGEKIYSRTRELEAPDFRRAMSRFLMSSRLFLTRMFFPPNIVFPSRPAHRFRPAPMTEISLAVQLVVAGAENLQGIYERPGRPF
jgi:hypothetical protein